MRRRLVEERDRGAAMDVPQQLLLALPFALTIAALVLNRRRSQEPLHLGVPYFRGER